MNYVTATFSYSFCILKFTKNCKLHGLLRKQSSSLRREHTCYQTQPNYNIPLRHMQIWRLWILFLCFLNAVKIIREILKLTKFEARSMPTSRCRKPSMMNVSVAKVSSTCPSLSQGFSSNDQISKGDNEEIGNSRRNHLSVRWWCFNY